MADALVFIALEKLTNVLAQQMGQQIDQQMKLFVGAANELKRLKDTFESIRAVLADAESRQVEKESAQLWLSRLRYVSYDIVDLLDDYQLLSAHDNDDTNDSDDDSCTCYSCLDALFNYGVTRYKLACDIKEIRTRLDDIAKDKGQFNSGIQISINFNFQGKARPVRRSRTMTSSYMNEEMIGRDDDLKTVINWLVSGISNSIGQEDGRLPQQQQVQVVAIVGIGGLGKTTLARKIYHDREVQDHFREFLYWVCVSQDFDPKRLLKAIIEEVTGAGTSLSELNALQKEIARKLKGKCFLLVLDDVWNSDKRRWNALQPCLAVGSPGSRILVTTRLLGVAKTMKAAHIHKLEGLSDDHSWTLFGSAAFDGQTEEEYSDKLEVAKQIVYKCKGVPLSITVMGSMLYSKRTVQDWQNILESQIWSLQEARNEILPALWLSYDNLPPHLKQCFVFCSIYAEDEAMPKDELVGMWIVQGFIQLDGNRELEVIGAEYVDDLVAWSMLQEQVNDGQMEYTMHDLLHDLAKFIAEGEINHSIGSEVEKSYKFPTDNVRHAVLNFNRKDSISPTSINAKKLRTLLLKGVVESNGAIVDLFHQARFLRALSFSPSREFSKAICKLKHLRYLDLSWSWIKELPISFGKLNQLRYLKMASSKIVMLPDSIGKLNELRYLNLVRSGTVRLPDSIGKLNQLRYLNLARSGIVRLPDSIGKLKQLEYLDLSHSEILELPESVNHLSNLHTLKLCYCHELKRLPRRMDKMVNLRYLDIEGTSSLECLPQGFGRISCLQSLSKFIVGGEGGCGIHELQGLNALEESLEIEHLERVPSKEEAEKAELWNKKKLRRLVLRTSIVVAATDVLEGLRPNVNLEELILNELSTLKLPSWIEDSSFSKLTKLEVDGFSNSKILPGIGKLPALKYLKLDSVGIRNLGHEFYYGNSSSSSNNSCGPVSISAAFPKLEELYLICLKELKEWELPIMTTAEGDNAIVEVINIMPHLSKLELFYCSKLEVLPRHLDASPLKSLEIYGPSRIKTRECFSSFRLLENLTWRRCGLENERLAEEGWEQLESLENLTIERCWKLDSVPEGLRQLKKLKRLILYFLPELRDLPCWLGELESLEFLEIGQLDKL